MLSTALLYRLDICLDWKSAGAALSMNASLVSAPEVFVSKPCQGTCCASKREHTPWAHITHRPNFSRNFLHKDLGTEEELPEFVGWTLLFQPQASNWFLQ